MSYPRWGGNLFWFSKVWDAIPKNSSLRPRKHVSETE
jgi:hypothetical protein